MLPLYELCRPDCVGRPGGFRHPRSQASEAACGARGLSVLSSRVRARELLRHRKWVASLGAGRGAKANQPVLRDHSSSHHPVRRYESCTRRSDCDPGIPKALLDCCRWHKSPRPDDLVLREITGDDSLGSELLSRGTYRHVQLVSRQNNFCKQR